MTESFTHSGARALALSLSLPPPLSLPLSLSLSGCSRAKMVARCGEEGIRPMSLDILASRSVPRAPPPGAPGGGICVCVCVCGLCPGPSSWRPRWRHFSRTRSLSLSHSVCVCLRECACLSVFACEAASARCVHMHACARACERTNDTENGGHCTHCPYRHTHMLI
jgi:hypothetical protein